MKTRREYMKALPLQKRLQAIENIRRNRGLKGLLNEILDEIPRTESVLSGTFVYGWTKQGHDYWWAISTKYFK